MLTFDVEDAIYRIVNKGDRHMQKRHFEMIAGCVARSRMAVEFIDRNAKRREARLDGIRSVAIDLAATLGHHNPDFDKARFMKACGFSAAVFESVG